LSRTAAVSISKTSFVIAPSIKNKIKNQQQKTKVSTTGIKIS